MLDTIFPPELTRLKGFNGDWSKIRMLDINFFPPRVDPVFDFNRNRYRALLFEAGVKLCFVVILLAIVFWKTGFFLAE